MRRNIKTFRIYPGAFNSQGEYDQYVRNIGLFRRVIELARDEFVFGIKDTGRGPEYWNEMRADALLFFVDGHYRAMLEYCGIDTEDFPMGLWPEVKDKWDMGLWVHEIAELCREYAYCPYWLDDIGVIQWAHRSGELYDNKGLWDGLDARMGYFR